MLKKLVLYTHKVSPAGRTAHLVIKALKLDAEISEMNVFMGQHFNDEYKKINPVQTIPALDDNGFMVWDSHAIAIYLAQKYGNGSDLYPNDVAKQAKINSVLFFESTVLFARLRFCTDSFTIFGKTQVSETGISYAKYALKLFENLLQSEYVAGDTMTIADLSCLTSITTLHGLLQPDAAKYLKTFAWLDRMTKLPYYEEVNGEGLKAAQKLVTKLAIRNSTDAQPNKL